MDPIDWEESESARAEAGPRPGEREVFVRGLELIGSIGVYAHEHRYEQRIAVSLRLRVRDTYDGRTDDLAHVYDYDHAIRAVRGAVDAGHYNLIETLAERIAEACLAHPHVVRVAVAVEKPDIVESCAAVGVRIVRHAPGR